MGKLVIVGAGLFGLTAADALQRRGHQVTVLERSKHFPPPKASTNDLNKVVRVEYGSDSFYTDFALEALHGWELWNGKCEAEGMAPLYHSAGVAILSNARMRAGSFEYESFRLLKARGLSPQRLTPERLQQYLPMWNAEECIDGFFDENAGWIESDRLLQWLGCRAEKQGVRLLLDEEVIGFLGSKERFSGVSTRSGREFFATQVIVATGAWLARLVPELKVHVQAVAQPLLELLPDDVESCPQHVWVHLPYYGFPPLADGTVKVGEHAAGHVLDPDHPREAVDPKDVERLQSFLRRACPPLGQAKLKRARYCFYADSRDGDFYLTRLRKGGLIVLGGGSGHAAKFAPVLGTLAADIVEDKPNMFAARFRWRVPSQEHREAARRIR